MGKCLCDIVGLKGPVLCKGIPVRRGRAQHRGSPSVKTLPCKAHRPLRRHAALSLASHRALSTRNEMYLLASWLLQSPGAGALESRAWRPQPDTQNGP